MGNRPRRAAKSCLAGLPIVIKQQMQSLAAQDGQRKKVKLDELIDSGPTQINQAPEPTRVKSQSPVVSDTESAESSPIVSDAESAESSSSYLSQPRQSSIQQGDFTIFVPGTTAIRSVDLAEYKVPKDPARLDENLVSYYNDRVDIFSLYEKGIMLDQESWYSVTYEKAADHIAQRMLEYVDRSCVLDLFCGVGGNAIAFAKSFDHVLAVDHDLIKISMAIHNAEIYGVRHKITFIHGDAVQFLQDYKTLNLVRSPFKSIFLSPPWGGTEYVKQFSLATMEPLNGKDMLSLTSKHASTLVFYLPRTTPTLDILRMLGERTREFEVEIEEVRDGYRYKAKVVYLRRREYPR